MDSKTLKKEMLKILPEDQRRSRRLVAMSVTICLFTVFAWSFYKIFNLLSPQNNSKITWGFRKYWQAYLVLIPVAF